MHVDWNDFNRIYKTLREEKKNCLFYMKHLVLFWIMDLIVCKSASITQVTVKYRNHIFNRNS